MSYENWCTTRYYFGATVFIVYVNNLLRNMKSNKTVENETIERSKNSEPL